jgi:hypothetical protein
MQLRSAILVVALSATPNTWSRLEFVPDVKPGVYRGIDRSGTSFIEVRLSAGGRGVMKICWFPENSGSIQHYTFTWAGKGSAVTFNKLEKISKWDEKIKSLNGEWKGSFLNLTVKGSDWEMSAQLPDAELWTNAEARLRDQKP